MKFICLGHFDQETLDAMTLEEVKAFIGECRAYGEVLSQGGHVVGIELLQSPDYAKTVQSIGGEIMVSDGSVAKMKKVLIPIITLEVDDINHAVELMSKHPAISKSGSFEIRPVEDLSEMIE